MILTKAFFANYKYLGSMIKSMDRRLRYLENHPLISEYGVVKGSMENFPYTACHFVVSGSSVKSSEERENTVNQLTIDLEGNKQLYEDMKMDIERFIFDNPDLTLEEQTIFRLKFIDEMSFEKIGDELGFDKSSISKKIDRVLERLDDGNPANEISSQLR